MNIELLNWLSNMVNFTVLAYIALSIVNTSCFSVFQMSLSAVGLFSSISVSVISIYIKYNEGYLK